MRLLSVAKLAMPLSLGLLLAAPIQAQLPERLRDYPLATRGTTGESVAPMFNGWVANEDGSTTMVFGFANQNRSNAVDIPLGPNNKLEPEQFQGAQPTHFPVYNRGGFVGIQERGAFGVVVPADMAGTEVVWTLSSGGKTYSIPARATSPAYELSAGEAAAGSMRPAIQFSEDGPVATDSVGIYAAPQVTTVGKPVTLSAMIKDRGNRVGYEGVQEYYPLGTGWVLHQGPANAKPEIAKADIPGRMREAEGISGKDWSEVSTQVTFPEPGDYVIRLRVDNFMAPDSKFDNVCCWSNAYFPVTVNP